MSKREMCGLHGCHVTENKTCKCSGCSIGTFSNHICKTCKTFIELIKTRDTIIGALHQKCAECQKR